MRRAASDLLHRLGPGLGGASRAARAGWTSPSAVGASIGPRSLLRSSLPRVTDVSSVVAPTARARCQSTAANADADAEDAEACQSGVSASGEGETGTYSEADHEHAVISTFDLFSIGLGPSSSHTVGPMRAGNIFITDLKEANLLHRVSKIYVSLYGSLALTGEGHMTPSALILGLESADVETVDTASVPTRFEAIKATKRLFLGRDLPGGGGKEIAFDYDADFRWQFGKKLPLHSNGMRLMVFDDEGYMLATNDFFSVGGGFVVNGALSTAPNAASLDMGGGAAKPGVGHPADLAENLFYKEIRRSDAAGDRRAGAEIKPTDPNVGKLDRPEEEDGSGKALSTTDSLSATSSSAPAVGNGNGNKERAFGSQHPRFAFRDAQSLLALCNKHNLTIAQLVYENEKSHGYSDDEVRDKLWRIWEVMDGSIHEGVQAPEGSTLPGSLRLHRRAPALYRRLTRGVYPARGGLSPRGGETASVAQLRAGGETGGPASTAAEDATSNKLTLESIGGGNPQHRPTAASLSRRAGSSLLPRRVHGDLTHPVLLPSPVRRTTFPAMDYLTVYAMAVNETNAAGGRIVTAPTNGAAGIIPAVLKYTVQFVSDEYQVEHDVLTFLLTASAIGMLYKRGATISAAEGGCMAEVGVACSMAAAGFAACMGASPETVAQAAEIGIEHNLGLTCDPIGGLVQAPCIERNALGAVKAISAANLALSSDPRAQKVSLDDAIRAMRVTALGMRNEFKETSLSGLATSVPVPVSVPDC